ncbi:tail sheath protein [Burkholderia phage Maja]|uniref:Tail sheath protein n=1 Tax=Burkholderia phage Maja TaxID=2767571 RepID=A0A7S6U093_9CAUD|nr:tail sheath protein [Burkholderia phage Maja]
MISQSRYVRIVSGVGGGAPVAQRRLIMRVMTTNAVLPPGIVFETNDSDQVGAVFGAASEEYKRSLAYLGFISKSIESPSLISFARWVDTAIASMIVGDSTKKDLAGLKAVANPTLSLSVGGTVVPIAGIDLSTAVTLTDVAALLQAAIRASANAELATATVTYNTTTNQFVLTGSTTGAAAPEITAVLVDQASDISTRLGWTTTGTVSVPGQDADAPDAAISKSAAISTNFGSFVFTNAKRLTNDQTKDVAAWNASQNNMYMFSTATTLANLGALYALVKGYSGCALNLYSESKPVDFIEQAPCEILAATNYARVNATQNYMYYQFESRNVTVTDDATANLVDANRCNYIGQTQSAGQPLAFYQRGILCGGPNDAVDMNIYGNEMWMKAAISAQILALFLSVPRVPANETGESMLLSVIQGVVNTAKNNGTISAGKNLTVIQQQYITQISGDPNAWRQVANIGYWLNITFSSYVNDNTKLTEWKASYQLIYSKDDSIRFVEGTDTLI